jgi:hypothetical protein
MESLWRAVGIARWGADLERRAAQQPQENAVHSTATIVPAGALFRRDGNWKVFAVVAGRAELRTVTLLRRSGRFAAVATGVVPGDTVIVYPTDSIASGVRVNSHSARGS